MPQFSTLVFAALSALSGARAGLPNPIHGVNLGSWLVLEPWMLPAEWVAMGGQRCDDCSTCIASEFAFAQAYPNDVDSKFQKHWQSWFNATDVQNLHAVGINTVRIPLGYWIIEALVDRKTEFYPRGGLKELRRGLKQLQNSGITAILDHHALPGVASPGQMFAGRCTNDVEFYTDKNYHRALVWTAVMTALAHLDGSFSNVAALEAINEPIMNADQTPGYGNFQKNFVQTVRAVELVLGIPVPGWNLDSNINNQILKSNNFTECLTTASSSGLFSSEVKTALVEAVPILLQLGVELGLSGIFNFRGAKREALTTTFMDVNWQYNSPSNPADAKIGPQLYDNHLYYSFGGVADANEDAYLKSICNLQRVQNDAALDNSPLVFGEWGLSTQFAATDAFIMKWADAQKRAYSMGAGWIFWNFKVEKSDLAGDLARQWSYLEGIDRGYLTRDPSKMNDPHVCDAYVNAASV